MLLKHLIQHRNSCSQIKMSEIFKFLFSSSSSSSNHLYSPCYGNFIYVNNMKWFRQTVTNEEENKSMNFRKKKTKERSFAIFPFYIWIEYSERGQIIPRNTHTHRQKPKHILLSTNSNGNNEKNILSKWSEDGTYGLLSRLPDCMNWTILLLL